MSKDSISQYSTAAASNTDIAGINVNTGWPPNNVGPAFRELMAQLADVNTGAAQWNNVPVKNSNTSFGSWNLTTDASNILKLQILNTSGTVVSEPITANSGTVSVALPLALAAPGTSVLQAVRYGQFNPSLSNPWRVSLPGNLLMQGGSSTVTVDASKNVTVSFGTAFAATPYNVIAANGNAVQSQTRVNYCGANTVSFVCSVPDASSGDTVTVSWMAIGHS